MRKTPRNRKKAPLLPIPVDGAFHHLAVDCLGPFPESYSGNRYVVVFSDYLTRWPEAFTVSTIDAHVIAKLLINEIFCCHGSPKTLLSDRGKNFLSKLIREVCKLLRTDKLNTSPYHPERMALLSVLIVIFPSRYQCTSPQTKKIWMNSYHQSYSRIARHPKRQLGIRLSTSFMAANRDYP